VTPEQTTRMNQLAARANVGEVLSEDDSSDLRRLTRRYRAEQRTVADLRNLVDDLGPAVAREVWDAARKSVFPQGGPKAAHRPKTRWRDTRLKTVVEMYRAQHPGASYLEVARWYRAAPHFTDDKLWPDNVTDDAIEEAMRDAVEGRTANPGI
jgi:hypothetical protein